MILTLKNIHKSFGDLHVLNGVNLCLERGLVYTIKGGNGSGKTTLINIISGFIPPTQGTIEFKEKKITKFAPYRLNRLGIGRTFQDLRLATQMTVYENILLALETKQFAYTTKEQEKRANEILKNTIYDLHNNGVTFIIVEHKKQLMDDLVNKEIVLELGTIKTQTEK